MTTQIKVISISNFTAVPTGDTESQADSDWIHYYAWMGGLVKRTDAIRLFLTSELEEKWLGDGNRSLVSQSMCVMCLGGYVFACICSLCVLVRVHVCVIISLWNQFPRGCASISFADSLIYKA